MYSIGVDIGGMSIKIGLVDLNGNIVEIIKVKTSSTVDGIVDDIITSINKLLSNTNISFSNLKGIGIGCPGSVSGDKGVVDFLPNLGWIDVPLVDLIKKKIGSNVLVKLANDADVATLAEVLYGSAKGYDNAVMFTLGTGVGGGVVIDKKLYLGNGKKGAELGHATLIMDGLDCTCGRKGCIECYVSATALIRQTKEAMLKDKNSKMWDFVSGDINAVDGRTAFECAKQGDKMAIIVQDNYIKYLGESMLNMFNIFRPEVFILGGGVSAQGKYLTDKLNEYCEQRNYGYKFSPKVKIVTASLGNDAGILGATCIL